MGIYEEENGREMNMKNKTKKKVGWFFENGGNVQCQESIYRIIS